MKKVKPYLKPSIYIIFGAFLIAIGVNVFLAPNKISSGGVSTIATILLHLFNVRMSITTFLANLILFIPSTLSANSKRSEKSISRSKSLPYEFTF